MFYRAPIGRFIIIFIWVLGAPLCRAESQTLLAPAASDKLSANLIAKIMSRYTTSEFSKPNHMEVLLSPGFPTWEVIKAAQFGYTKSESFCGLKDSVLPRRILNKIPFTEKISLAKIDSNEVDAIRHFMISAFLAAKVGMGKARKYMTTREGNETLSENATMDLYNNDMGLNYGQYLHNRYFKKKVSDRGLRKEIFQRGRHLLNTGQLSVLISGRDGRYIEDCTLPEFYPNQLHLTVDPSDHLIPLGSIPESCQIIPQDQCKQRISFTERHFCYTRTSNVTISKLEAETSRLLAQKNLVSTLHRDVDVARHKFKINQLKICRDDMQMVDPSLEADEDPDAEPASLPDSEAPNHEMIR